MIIGVAGRAGAGKDTFADAIVEYHCDISALKMSFAEPLKRAVMAVHGLAWGDVFTEAGKKAALPNYPGMTVRSALQDLGMWARDWYGPDHWVRLLLHNVERAGVTLVVVPDVRFPNEAEAIRAAGGMVVRIDRPGSILAGTEAAHPSEAGIPDELVDEVFLNDGSRSDLRAFALDIAEECQRLGWRWERGGAR